MNSLNPCHIAIIGRPNVGKSTLFNRLFGRRRALVHNQPGVTRDRIEETTEWWLHRKKFPVKLIDTGGLGGELFSREIQIQVETALEVADIALFVVDSQTGVTPADEEILVQFQKSGLFKKTPVIGIVNKVDDEIHEVRASEFYSLGFDHLLTLSSEHGRGIDDLKIQIAELCPQFLEEKEEKNEEIEEVVEEVEVTEEPAPAVVVPRIAILGRPNVGKSTLLNTLLGENRVITSPIAGTTVDSVDVKIELNGKPFTLIDTAGIRRKSKTEQGVEVLSIVQARKALERADIALLVLDGEVGISDQDEKIGGLIEEAGCSVVLVMNKWDTQERNPKFTRQLASERIRAKMGYLKYAPIIFTSGLRGKGFEDLGDLLEEILHQKKLKIPTHEFTEWVRKESTIHNPMNAKFFLCHQTGRHPPTFVCHVNDPEKIHFSLKRHFLNALRERWGYMGTPIRLLFIEGKNRRSLPKSKKGAAKKPLRRPA